MPYRMIESGGGFIVVNSETGRRHSKRPLPRKRAVAQMRALYAAEGGAVMRNKSMVAVFKDAAGRYRWLSVSSTAYRDRDGEIVSTKALSDDVARADTDKDYGPLRWWHVPGADIGDCDYNAMCGRALVESGTFRDEAIGAAIAAKSSGLHMSLGFLHGSDQPDSEKVFHSIRRIERSLLPAGYASNLFTRFLVKETAVDETKKAALKALLGDEMAATVLAQVEQSEKTAEAQRVAFKEAEAVPAAPAAPTSAADDKPTVFDLTPEQFTALQMEAAQQANAPLLAALQGLVTAMQGNAVATKQAQDAAATKEVEQATRLKELTDAQTATAAEIATLKAQLATAEGKLTTTEKELRELQGETPRAIKERRASQSDATVIGDDHPLKTKDAQPGPDPGFFGFVTGGVPVPQ